tara:strand:+ start:442 stop:624 length:183 start_codon:yes stop_codon:yes gene_type:complete
MIIRYFEHRCGDTYTGFEPRYEKTYYTVNEKGLKFVKSENITQEEYLEFSRRPPPTNNSR